VTGASKSGGKAPSATQRMPKHRLSRQNPDNSGGKGTKNTLHATNSNNLKDFLLLDPRQLEEKARVLRLVVQRRQRLNGFKLQSVDVEAAIEAARLQINSFVKDTSSDKTAGVVSTESPEQSSTMAPIDWQDNVWWGQQSYGGLQTGCDWEWNRNWSWSWPNDWSDANQSRIGNGVEHHVETAGKGNDTFSTGSFSNDVTYAGTFSWEESEDLSSLMAYQ